MEFFGYLNFHRPLPETLSISRITTAQFTDNFHEFKEAINKEIHNKESNLSQLEKNFEQNPPLILEKFNYSESDKENIINYFQLYTELYRLSWTLWINKQVLALENSYSRKDIKDGILKILSLKQSAITEKDKRLDKYSKYEHLQLQLEKSKLSHNQDSARDKFIALKKHLSFSVMQIKKGKGTIKLADYLINQKPFIPKNRIEGHCRIACSYRCKELNDEINEISNYFPFVQMREINLSITVARDENPEYRFDVIFPIQTSYPWCKIEAKTNVFIGDSSEINSKIQEICSNVSFSRRPILEICAKIYQEFIES